MCEEIENRMEEADDSLDKVAGMIPAAVFTKSVSGIRGIRRIGWIRRLCRFGRKFFKRYVRPGQFLAAARAVDDRIITALCGFGGLYPVFLHGSVLRVTKRGNRQLCERLSRRRGGHETGKYPADRH